MKKLYLFLIITFMALQVGGCASLLWEHGDKADITKKKRAKEKSDEVLPAGLKNRNISPISPESAKRTALSRPRAVKVEVLTGEEDRKKYFEVIEEKSGADSAPVIDESARAIRAITYDDNSIAKDFPISFGILWERIIEGVINMPLATIDRSSGVIATTWMYDQRTNKSMLDSLSPFASNPRVRYKYVLRVVDMGNITRVRVIPFAQTVSTGFGWVDAKASLLVSEKFFERIEKELMIPITSRRF